MWPSPQDRTAASAVAKEFMAALIARHFGRLCDLRSSLTIQGQSRQACIAGMEKSIGRGPDIVGGSLSGPGSEWGYPSLSLRTMEWFQPVTFKVREQSGVVVNETSTLALIKQAEAWRVDGVAPFKRAS